jgi:hypothetical protein
VLPLGQEKDMRIDDVPQDKGMIDNDNLREICYAVDTEGRYVLAPSVGWEPKNIANSQAWELIRESVSDIRSKVKAGKLSPLAYHMARNQMNVGLLAKYVRYSRLRVWSHLKPAGFRRLTPDILSRYAEIFDMEVDALQQVPDDAQESMPL